MKNSQETFITRFLKLEASGGIILMIAAVIALILANTPLKINIRFTDRYPSRNPNRRIRNCKTIIAVDQ